MISSMELLAILIAAFFLFGPRKLPELARSLGSAVGEFKKAQRAAELELTTFDSYTRRTGNEETAGVNEQEKRKENEGPKTKTGPIHSLEDSLESRPSIPDEENFEASGDNEKLPKK